MYRRLQLILILLFQRSYFFSRTLKDLSTKYLLEREGIRNFFLLCSKRTIISQKLRSDFTVAAQFLNYTEFGSFDYLIFTFQVNYITVKKVNRSIYIILLYFLPNIRSLLSHNEKCVAFHPKGGAQFLTITRRCWTLYIKHLVLDVIYTRGVTKKVQR